MIERKRVTALALAFVMMFCLLSTPVSAGENGIGQVKKDLDSLCLQDINSHIREEIDGQKALSNAGYFYQGWRTNGGPWFNAGIDWLAEKLEESGFSEEESNSGDNYYLQIDIPKGNIWAPQYASLEIVGEEGDKAEGQSYNFDFVLDTFDPTSKYYPEHITHDWIMSNIGTEEEVLINERCHLATNSGFTSPSDTELSTAEEAAITADVVYVGQVNRVGTKYTWTENTDVSLKDKIIFGTNSRGNVHRLAVQEGAKVALCSQINDYNHPTIDGIELYPNTVQYAGVSNTNPKGPLAFNLSPQDESFLVNLLEEAEAEGKTIQMKAMAIGNIYPYSTESPLRTMVAEIKGSTKPDERVIFLAHVQEPGVCDNASGVGLQLEIVRTLKELIDEGKLPRPDRTLTFVWGAEMTMADLWMGHNADALDKVKAVLVLDMVGEDPEKTGGIMRIEKTPDPSATYNYGNDLLPGQEPETSEEYVRLPDTHTLWGAGEVPFDPFPGHYLNDLYFESASLVAEDYPGFQVGSNPYEGGSDHQPFLENIGTLSDGTEGNKPIPALLTWHFTDYVYHTSMDTMDKASATELRNVGATTINVGYIIANAAEAEAAEIMNIVAQRAEWRFAWEMKNSAGSLKWAYDKSTDKAASVDNALAQEIEILNAWAVWYKEAVQASGTLCDEEATDGYTKLESKYMDDIDQLLKKAIQNAESIAKKLKK